MRQRVRRVKGVDGVSVERNISFLLGRAVSIIEGLVESPTDALDIKLAQEFLADYRKWLDAAS